MITALFWIVVGLIAGALAKLIMPGDDPGGIIVKIFWALLVPSLEAFFCASLVLEEAGVS